MQQAADQGTQPQRVLTRGDVFASFIRWLFFSHANYNWEIYQGTGFAHAMTPIIRKLYKDPEDIKAALKRHLVFFNTEPDTGGVIHGMTIALEEQRALGNTEIDDETITNVKSGLMGPFAGLGDTLKQGTWFPVWQSIAIGVALAANGSVSGILGPIIYTIAAAIYTFAFGWWVYYEGYRQGQALVSRLLQTGLLDDVRTGAAVLGAAVLGALGAQFITVSTGIQWDVVAGTGETAVTQTFSLQTDVFDKLYPSLLPLILLLLIIWLLRRGVSVVDLILYLFGITLASALIESVSRFALETGNAFGIFSGHGVPSLIGIALLIIFALFFGQRRGNMRAAVNFVIGFVVVAVVFGFLSVNASAPLQLLSHF
jgi:mannose/fructose/N-acetylgalactosamine-specific phosphotransferase system component IID